MTKDFRQRLRQGSQWLRQLPGRIRATFALGLPRAKSEEDLTNSRHNQARNQFWTALREGQREADGHSRRDT